MQYVKDFWAIGLLVLLLLGVLWLVRSGRGTKDDGQRRNDSTGGMD